MAAQAVGVINNIAAQVENHEAVVQAGAISKIVALLNALVYKPSLPKSAHEDISNAAGVLGNLATEPAAQRHCSPLPVGWKLVPETVTVSPPATPP